MGRLKSIIKTIVFWLAFFAAALLGFGAIYRLTEKGGLGSITGWVFAGITLSLMFFLFMSTRRFLIRLFLLKSCKDRIAEFGDRLKSILKKIGLWMIPVLVACALPIFLYFILKYFNLSDLVARRIPVVLVFYFWGGYFLRKHGWSKAFGIVLFLTAIVLNLSFISPTYVTNEFKATTVFSIFPLLASIFLILRQGKLLRVLGALVIIFLVPTAFFMAFLSYSSSALITGQDRTTILASVEPLINDMFKAWNDKDYQKFSKDFSDEMKVKSNQGMFLYSRDESGKLISADELRKLAPQSDSPLVAVETRSIIKFTKVMYGVAFEKFPGAIHGIIVDFKKSDNEENKYLIVGFAFGPFESVNTDSQALFKALNSIKIYSISISNPNTKTTESYQCLGPGYDNNQAEKLAPNVSLRQKIDDEGIQLDKMATQLNEMGSQNSTNNYDAVANSYNARKATYEADQKQYDSEMQAYKNYIKTHCAYEGYRLDK